MVAKFKKKQNSREEKIFQIIFTILSLFLIGFLIISNLKMSQKRQNLEGEVESLEKEIQILEEKKSKLEAGISQTEKESYWEEKIREQGYIKEGENPVVVLKEKEQETTEKEINIWNPKNWLEWIKNKMWE